jgi:hypothetical protein
MRVPWFLHLRTVSRAHRLPNHGPGSRKFWTSCPCDITPRTMVCACGRVPPFFSFACCLLLVCLLACGLLVACRRNVLFLFSLCSKPSSQGCIPGSWSVGNLSSKSIYNCISWLINYLPLASSMVSPPEPVVWLSPNLVIVTIFFSG